MENHPIYCKISCKRDTQKTCVLTLITKANQLPWQEDTPLPWQLAMVRGIAGSDLTVKFPGGKEPRMVGVGAIGEPWPVKLPLKTKEYPNIP